MILRCLVCLFHLTAGAGPPETALQLFQASSIYPSMLREGSPIAAPEQSFDFTHVAGRVEVRQEWASASLGASVWHAGLVLAHFLDARAGSLPLKCAPAAEAAAPEATKRTPPANLTGCGVVELGSGVSGLGSLVAARFGATAVASDGEEGLLSLLRRNLELNGVWCGSKESSCANDAGGKENGDVVEGRNEICTESDRTRDDKGDGNSREKRSDGSNATTRSDNGTSTSSVPCKGSWSVSEERGCVGALVLPWGSAEGAEKALSLLRTLKGDSLLTRAHTPSSSPLSATAPPLSTPHRPADLVLAADVVYPSNGEVWAALIESMRMVSGPDTVLLFAHTQRANEGEPFLSLASKVFRVRKLPLATMLDVDELARGMGTDLYRFTVRQQ